MLVLIIKRGFIMENSCIDESKLLRYFSGDLDPLEKKQVSSWINESEEHEKLAKDVGSGKLMQKRICRSSIEEWLNKGGYLFWDGFNALLRFFLSRYCFPLFIMK